jgi:hypothetical protein
MEPRNKELTDRIEKVQKCRRSSARTYASTIRRLGDKFRGAGKGYTKDLSWVHNKEIIERIKKFEGTLNVKRNLVNGMIIALKLRPNKLLLDQYTDYLQKLNTEVDTRAKSGVISEKMQKRWLSQKKVMGLWRLLARKVRLSQAYKRPKLVARDFKLISQYFILSLYVLTSPVRNTWASVTFHNQKGFENVGTRDANYLVIRRSGIQVYWNAFKTSGKMKEVVLNVPKKLEKVIRKHVKYLKKWFPENNRLLLNSRYEPMSSVSLTKFLQSLFFSYFRKRIGSSQLRSMFLSHKYSHEADEERKKIAREMLHSVDTQKFYIKKAKA